MRYQTSGNLESLSTEIKKSVVFVYLRVLGEVDSGRKARIVGGRATRKLELLVNCRDPNTSKIAHLSNHLQSQLRGQMDARNYGLAQAGQAYNNQMQPPGPLHLSGNSQAHSGNSNSNNSQLPSQMQPQITAQGLTPTQSQVPAQAHSGGAGGSAHSFPGNQVHLQLNHAQALSQLQGQSTMSQVPSSALSGGHASPGIFNQLSQQTSFPTLSKQLTPQPTGQVHSQSNSSLNQNLVNGGQQSLPGTPQSEISDLRSTA